MQGGHSLRTTFTERLRGSEPVLMVNPNHLSSTLAETLVRAGADAIFIDCEHGLASYENISDLSRAAHFSGGFAIVRPQNHERSILTRCLNANPDGLMVPLVHSAELAKRIVADFRSAAPDNYSSKTLICMIESSEAINDLDRILNVDGIDAFFVGPGDLSQSLGLSPHVKPGERRPKVVLDLVRSTLKRIRAAGKIAGTLAVKDDVSELVSQGAQLIYYHADPFVREGVNMMRQLVR